MSLRAYFPLSFLHSLLCLFEPHMVKHAVYLDGFHLVSQLEKTVYVGLGLLSRL